MTPIRLQSSMLALLLAGASAFAQAPVQSTVEVPSSAIQPIADASTSGTAAWYGRKFNGRRTASGQRFSAAALTAAHPDLPFGTRVRVTNTNNKKSVVLTINDRLDPSAGRIIDVSRASAERLGMLKSGTAPVRIERVGARAANKAARGNAGRGTLNRQR